MACFLQGLVRSISCGGWHAFCGGDQAYTWTAMTSAVWADIVSVWHWLVLCSMSGYAGFLKLLDATAFKSLYANTAGRPGSAPLWAVTSLSLPGFNRYITCLQVVFQNILVPFVLTPSWTLTTDQLSVEESLWYSIFLHASKMSNPSELALDEQSFNAFYLATLKYSRIWYLILPRDGTDFSEASKMELVKFFRRHQVQDSLLYKSMVRTTVLYTQIFVLRWIPSSNHSLWCNRPKLALALLIGEFYASIL